MRFPLRYQILLPFALVLAGAIIAVSVTSAVLATHRAESQIEGQLQSIAATLAESSFPLTEPVLRQMHGLSQADFVFQGQESRTVANRPLELPPQSSAVPADHWRQLRLGPSVTVGDEHFFEMVLSLPARGTRSEGRLFILYPERSWEVARNEAAWPPLAIGALALVATAAAATIIAGRLTRPILELRSQVNRIAKSDYSPMPLPARHDELRDLAAAVNQMAQQLDDSQRAIRRSERLATMGQLAGGLAHHLRNNVTGALMAVQLHARECNSDRESLEVALRQLALTEENLKQFLASPHQDGNAAPPLNRVTCAAGDIVREVAALVGPSLRHRRIELSTIDRTGGEDELSADPSQLRQLLINLALNAADAAGPGGKVRIETALLPLLWREGRGEGVRSRSLILRVIDNGLGPPANILPRLFEPFATSKPEGVGLGLAVAQQIANAHGGQIVFHRSGGETFFEVHLPVTYSHTHLLTEQQRTDVPALTASRPLPTAH
jgi:signal transduction histidine kinase